MSYERQATNAVYHAPNPISHDYRPRSTLILHIHIIGGGHLTMPELNLMGATGERSYGQMSAVLSWERMEGFGLHAELMKRSAQVVFVQFINQEG